jgi:hypothetical protein
VTAYLVPAGESRDSLPAGESRGSLTARPEGSAVRRMGYPGQRVDRQVRRDVRGARTGGACCAEGVDWGKARGGSGLGVGPSRVPPTIGRSGCGVGESVQSRAAVRLDAASVGEQFASVLEYDHAVAEKAPALLRVARDDTGGVAVNGVGWRTGGLVLAHFPVSSIGCCLGHCDQQRTLLLRTTHIRAGA